MNAPSLKDMAAIKVALDIWNNCDFLDIDRKFFLPIGGIQADEVAKSVPELELPAVLKDLVEEKINLIVEEMNDWWDDHEWLPQKPVIFLDAAKYIIWRPDGTIDKDKTEKRLQEVADEDDDYFDDESDPWDPSPSDSSFEYDLDFMDCDDDDYIDDEDVDDENDEEEEEEEEEENVANQNV